MKKYILASLTFAFLFSACTNEDYNNLNIDPKNPIEVPGEFLFANATKSLFGQMISTSVNRNVFRLFAQQWTETQYTNETNYDIRNRAIPDAHWGQMYREVLFDLKKAKESVEASNELLPGEKANQLAIITTLEVYTWQQLVDTFGDIPYTEALQGTLNMTPKYDKSEDIYNDLIAKMDEAIATISLSDAGFGSSDIVYAGNMSAWKALAASLKLKLAIQLSDVNPSLAKQKAEEAYNTGLIQSNEQNFAISYENNNTNANPLYADLVLSGRADFVPADTYVDYLNDLDDPRRTVFFDNNLGDGRYVGGIYGALNNYTQFTHIGNTFYSRTLEGVLLDYSEVQFLLAEARERGFNVGEDASTYYTNGIRANMEYWNIGEDEITAYLAQPNVAYGTAPGSWKEKIGKQFWISLYNRGFEAWTVWRRLDAPVLRRPQVSNLEVPVRFTYPVSERNLNGSNYEAAASSIGGDNLNTKLFWDKF